MVWIFAISSFLCVWGFGYLIVLAVRQQFFSDVHRHFTSQQSGVLILVLLFIVINLVVDILYMVLDPRVRLAGKS